MYELAGFCRINWFRTRALLYTVSGTHDIERDLNTYIKGKGQTPWFAIGLSVMATQASAITFLSTPGQGYLGGLSFVQIYFGVPIALIIIAIFFLPIFQRLNIYTAYEFLEKRFDCKTRLLGAGLFLLQRGLGAGLTIYAPAIVLTSCFQLAAQFDDHKLRIVGNYLHSNGWQRRGNSHAKISNGDHICRYDYCCLSC